MNNIITYPSKCSKCGETHIWKTKGGFNSNTPICKACRKYPEIVLKDGEYFLPCPKCQILRPLGNRFLARKALKNLTPCRSCAQKVLRESESSRFVKSVRGYKQENNIIIVPCPKCKTPHSFVRYYKARLFLQKGHQTQCCVCATKVYNKIQMRLDIRKSEPEKWKSVAGYTNYSISSYGRCRNEFTGRLLTPIFNPKNGYFIYFLSWDLSNGRRPNVLYAHRLVLSAFVRKPKQGQQSNHLNGDKMDNRLANLVWVTPQANSQHRTQMWLLSQIN